MNDIGEREFRLREQLVQVRACRRCEGALPLGPRPVLSLTGTARLLIIGQAPGTRVHETGVPWNDRSGDRLRSWMDVDRAVFYDPSRIAIMPMGFCYPGRLDRGGDAPPRPECAPTWHAPLRALLPEVRLTLLVGGHAQRFYLRSLAPSTVTATCARWRDFLPAYLPLPHPSWRTTAWQRRHPWFDADLLPALQRHVKVVLCHSSGRNAIGGR
ncbi:MAG: uracil-DNA glycosylase family protein [Rhodospirillales bacterium]|nr:MAG: uracil-DNA glycosylase family protein [Rhodospirillales bacterium]